VTAPPLNPEPLDLDILREMYRDSPANLAAIDPRLNATRIAKRLRVGRARVAARLKAWNKSGFLVRYDVWLNPALIGWQGAWVSIRVDHPHAKPTLLGHLAMIEGAVSGLELIGEWVSLGLVAPDAASLERRIGLVRGLAGVRSIEDPVLWDLPKPKRALSALDIRIVRALREHPTATLSDTARRVGISTRTMTRRYSALIDDSAVWFVPILDFRAISYPVVSVGVTLRPEAGRETVARQIRTRYPLTLDIGASVAGSPAHIFFVVPPSAAHLEELERFVGAIKGVINVEAQVMVRIHCFSSWFDRHLETLTPPRA